jgi:hypothetical protein
MDDYSFLHHISRVETRHTLSPWAKVVAAPRDSTALQVGFKMLSVKKIIFSLLTGQAYFFFYQATFHRLIHNTLQAYSVPVGCTEKINVPSCKLKLYHQTHADFVRHRTGLFHNIFNDVSVFTRPDFAVLVGEEVQNKVCNILCHRSDGILKYRAYLNLRHVTSRVA